MGKFAAPCVLKLKGTSHMSRLKALVNGLVSQFAECEVASQVRWCAQVVAMVKGNDLFVANAGDSRCVFSRRGIAMAMTTDHKPTDPAELARITKVWSTTHSVPCAGQAKPKLSFSGVAFARVASHEAHSGPCFGTDQMESSASPHLTCRWWLLWKSWCGCFRMC